MQPVNALQEEDVMKATKLAREASRGIIRSQTVRGTCASSFAARM